ncbi:MAG TPA: response regulator [Bacteroidia bacterium]|jgi:PleD family two-component response regulator
METQFILVVENGLLDRGMLSEALQKQGFFVRFASDAETALRILIQVPPSLILLSLIMPNLDSYTFTRILKNDEATRSITIMALSDIDSNHKQIISSGFDGSVYMEDHKDTFAKKLRNFF